jgi:excisionase family DNA binding protein
MPGLTTIQPNHARRARRDTIPFGRRADRARLAPSGPARRALSDANPARRPSADATASARIRDSRPFALIDAKAASELLGVPHTWLLAQACERRIPHHRLGHYVRFDPKDLREWLDETRLPPHDIRFRPHGR